MYIVYQVSDPAEGKQSFIAMDESANCWEGLATVDNCPKVGDIVKFEGWLATRRARKAYFEEFKEAWEPYYEKRRRDA